MIKITGKPQERFDPGSAGEILQRTLAKPLSHRELQVLIALGEGKTTAEIRSGLKISGKTVATYMRRLKKKLELGNFNELIRAAVLLREGILPSASDAYQNDSLGMCPHCRKLFSVRRAKEDIPGLAGYRVLAAFLRRN
jgi:DNA-binding CsgD family transcriptional regulator